MYEVYNPICLASYVIVQPICSIIRLTTTKVALLDYVDGSPVFR